MRKESEIMKKIFIFIVLLFLITGCSNEKNSKFTIVATNFPCYDFVRAVVKGTDTEVNMLIKPGSEIHDFEPTPQDIIKIKNSKIFVYVGGESDEWIDGVLNDINPSETKIIRLLDLVENLNEEAVEGMEIDDEEIDEHVWTSPVNASKITEKLADEIIALDEENEEIYIKNSKRKELIFGDRFPFLYFTKEYGLTYYAAFPGCAEQTEASSKTISFLINKVKEDNIPVILHLELSNKKIAEAISKETGAKVLEFNSAHNISKKDFDSGITYIDIMKQNIETLKIALN